MPPEWNPCVRASFRTSPKPWEIPSSGPMDPPNHRGGCQRYSTVAHHFNSKYCTGTWYKQYLVQYHTEVVHIIPCIQVLPYRYNNVTLFSFSSTFLSILFHPLLSSPFLYVLFYLLSYFTVLSQKCVTDEAIR